MKLRRARAATCAIVATLTLGTAAGALALSGSAVAAPSHSARNSWTVLSGAAAEAASDGSVKLSWTTGKTREVRVYASTNPSFPAPTGRQVAVTKAASVIVTGLDPAMRWYFQLVPGHKPFGGVVVAARSISLSTAPNGRDIGGYRTG